MLPEIEIGIEQHTAVAVESFDRQAQRLVADLHTPEPSTYWTDFLVTAAIGWTAFAVAVMLPAFSAGMLAATAITSLAFYRALCFVHEISHITRSALGRFETVWNWLAGVPLLMPSFVYVGVHQDHHSLSTYGTEQDPEYLPFSSSHRMTLGFAAHSILIPLFLMARFLVLAPVGLVWPRFHSWVAERASSLTMNPAYKRKVDAELLKRITRWELAILLVWGIAALLVSAGMIPARILLVWYLASASASVLNVLRTLGAHRYESSGEPRDRVGQLRDSIDVPGAWWSELWAPVGLRYHALHHYFPGLPYHNLPQAYDRLVKALPQEAPYHEVASRSLASSLLGLLRREKAATGTVRRARA